MTAALIPQRESTRLATLLDLEVLDTAADPKFDALAKVAAATCGVPISLISLTDDQRQWFKANIGLAGLSEMPREGTFCAHAILGDAVFEVSDATADSRFAGLPLVKGEPGIRFYAGAPIRMSDGTCVGTLCVMDRRPRNLTDLQRDVLQNLSVAVGHALEGRKVLRKLQQSMEQRAQSEQDVRAVVDNVPAMLAYWDRQLCCRFANRAYEKWFGVTPDAIVGTHIKDLLGAEIFALNKPYMDAALVGEPQSFERLIPGPDGTRRHALAHYVPDVVDGAVRGFLVHVTDVTDLKRAEIALRAARDHLATHDPLTGLLNRAEFEVRLQHLLGTTREDGSEHALIFISLDQFKLVNDACGPLAADTLLQQVSQFLQAAVGAGDILGRLGRDQFALVLDCCLADQSLRIAQQICDGLDQLRFHPDGERRFRVGASIGLAPLDCRQTCLALVMQAADAACSAARDDGGNRVHVWHEADAAIHARLGEMQWAARLEKALDDERFVLFAQRIFPAGMGSGRLHAELLLRMVDDDGGLIAPAQFIPAAERFHLCSRIDRWVVQQAIALFEGRSDLSDIDALCINLSGQSLGDKEFHRYILDALSGAGPDVCRCICLEITETAAVTNMANAALFVDTVRKLGVRVALDDFGAGASSFGYLKSLKVDLLKIDGQFISNVIDDPLNDIAVRCFVDVARVTGLKTVAEFVNAPEVLARMKRIGVDYVQGFFLHKPEPIDVVLQRFPRLTSALGRRLKTPRWHGRQATFSESANQDRGGMPRST